MVLRVLAALLVLAPSALPQAESVQARSRRVLDMVLAGKYEEVYALFGPQMRQAISLETFRLQGVQIDALGKPQEIGAPVLKSAGGVEAVTIPVRFAPLALDYHVVWTPDGKIAGMALRPAAQAAPPQQYPRPPYSKPDAFTEREVTVGDDAWKLPGTLAMPKGAGPFPALVLVHGSGPQDRDETVGGHKVFRDIAEGLASHGVAVLRYEKRTKVHGSACAADAAFTMTQETVEDAVRAAALLRATPGVDGKRIFVLGHSQGGYMMPRVLKADPRIAGGIIMAGNARPLEVLAREQAEYLLAQPSTSMVQRAMLDAMAKDPVSALKIPPAYLRDLEGYKPAEEAASLAVPLMILQGERDYQVSIQDVNMWKKALGEKPKVRFVTYPRLNHLFAAGEGKSLPSEYARSGHVDEKPLDDILAFLRESR